MALQRTHLCCDTYWFSLEDKEQTAECDLVLFYCRLGLKSGTEEDVGSWACLAAGFLGNEED